VVSSRRRGVPAGPHGPVQWVCGLSNQNVGGVHCSLIYDPSDPMGPVLVGCPPWERRRRGMPAPWPPWTAPGSTFRSLVRDGRKNGTQVLEPFSGCFDFLKCRVSQLRGKRGDHGVGSTDKQNHEICDSQRFQNQDQT